MLRWLEAVALPLDFGVTQGPTQHQHLLRTMGVIDEHSDVLGNSLANARFTCADRLWQRPSEPCNMAGVGCDDYSENVSIWRC